MQVLNNCNEQNRADSKLCELCRSQRVTEGERGRERKGGREGGRERGREGGREGGGEDLHLLRIATVKLIEGCDDMTYKRRVTRG